MSAFNQPSNLPWGHTHSFWVTRPSYDQCLITISLCCTHPPPPVAAHCDIHAGKTTICQLVSDGLINIQVNKPKEGGQETSRNKTLVAIRPCYPKYCTGQSAIYPSHLQVLEQPLLAESCALAGDEHQGLDELRTEDVRGAVDVVGLEQVVKHFQHQCQHPQTLHRHLFPWNHGAVY